MSGEKKFAVLIDADNVSDKYVKFILDEISNDGIATYKRIYGDWTKPSFQSWKNVLLRNSIMPVQQYSYTTGKNATDSAMIIDAMDILYSGNVDGFALVSSDSDFTRLASRLRESGMVVVGMGERKTPSAFISACNKFKYLDVLAKAETDKQASEAVEMGDALESVKHAVLTIIQENSDEDGWAYIGMIGNVLNKRMPDFDVRNFGYSKLTNFLLSLGMFEQRSERTGDNNKMVFLRLKTGAAPAEEAPAKVVVMQNNRRRQRPAVSAPKTAPVETPAAAEEKPVIAEESVKVETPSVEEVKPVPEIKPEPAVIEKAEPVQEVKAEPVKVEEEKKPEEIKPSEPIMPGLVFAAPRPESDVKPEKVEKRPKPEPEIMPGLVFAAPRAAEPVKPEKPVQPEKKYDIMPGLVFAAKRPEPVKTEEPIPEAKPVEAVPVETAAVEPAPMEVKPEPEKTAEPAAQEEIFGRVVKVEIGRGRRPKPVPEPVIEAPVEEAAAAPVTEPAAPVEEPKAEEVPEAKAEIEDKPSEEKPAETVEASVETPVEEAKPETPVEEAKPETASEPEAKPHRSRSRGRRKPAEAKKPAEEKPAEVKPEAETVVPERAEESASEPAAKKTSRTRRSRAKKSEVKEVQEASVEPKPQETEPKAESDAEPAKPKRRGRPKKAEAEKPAEAEAVPAAETAQKPKTRTRRPRKPAAKPAAAENNDKTEA